MVLAIFMFACKTPQDMTKKPVANAPLTGTHWTLRSVQGMEKVTAMREAFIVLDAEKSAAYGSSGCNRMTGSYTLNGKSLKFGPMAGTRMACDEASMKLEQALYTALGAVDGYTLKGDELHLLQGEKVLASFQAGTPEK